MKQLALSVCLGVLGFLTPVGAQTLINDNFNTNPANPNDVNWYSSAGTVTTFTGSTGALQFVSGDTTSNTSVFKQFTQTTLAVGESLQASFTFTGFTNPRTATTNNHFRIGLFDTSDTFTTNQVANPWTTGSGLPQGYQMAIGAGTTPGTSSFGYRTGQNNIVSHSAIGSANAFGLSDFTLPVSVVFNVTRTATGITLDGSYTRDSITHIFTQVIPVTSVFTFDTLYIGSGLNAVGQGFTIDNVNLTLVPEPSSYALLGLGVGALFALRRFGRSSSQP
jgi:hypothetical protein